MNSAELSDRTARAGEKLKTELGDLKGLGIVPGTGWGEGVDTAFKRRQEVPYSELGVPGSGLKVEGHRKTLKIGEIEGGGALVLGRVHPNENMTDPDLRQAMILLIGALRPHLEGLIITNGVGSLHGPVGLENGRLHSLVRTAILDALAWAHRGRRQERIRVGDIAIVDDVKTGSVGPLTPLGAGDFVDFNHAGIHRDDNRYFDIARRAVTAVQGRCPRVQARYIPGPQFEGPGDKIEFRAQGDDVIGMSGIQEALACTRHDIPFAHLVLATNGPFEPHSHEGNQDVGKTNAEKAAAIIRKLAKDWPRKS